MDSKTEEYSLNIDNNLSLYIPVVNENEANIEYIRKIFHDLNIGYIKSIDFIKNEYSNIQAFIHFDQWYNNICVSNLQERILNEKKEAYIIYDDPKYWILKKNINPIINNYGKQLEEIYNQNEKNYSHLINHFENLHKIINNQNNIIDELKWWKDLHETNIQYLCEQINKLQETNNKSHEINWREQSRPTKRNLE